MPPKRKPTTHDKGKGHVSGSSSRTRHVAEPPNDGFIPRFRTDEIEECYTKTWASKVCHKERQVARDDFSHHLLERVIQHCGWHKVADAPHAAYPILVQEFFTNFNPDIDVPESPHRYKTWVRGRWIRFSPTMIDKYYGLTRTDLVPLPAPHKLDMALVARYLYGRDDVWPLATPRFMHDQLTRELRVLHIFVSSNINPTRQRTRFTEHRAILLHNLAQFRKIDLGAHIFEFIRELATAVDSQCSIHFSYLISGLCLTQGILLFPTEEADPPAALLNARSVENSETKIAARSGRVHAAPAMNAGEDYPDDDAPAPPPAPAASLDLSVQMAQLMAAHTEMGRAIDTIQGTILHIQQTQDVVLGDLRVVTGQVGDLQRADAMTQSNLRTFDYQYHQLHDQMSRIGSRMETLDENVARISGTLSGLSQPRASFPTSASAGPPPHPDLSASHLPPGST
ncbi:Envelope-like protein [Abeliophyllum distichum]|uniref:Envelope-like protein n=1 Tax=Abeliophyllum distichum TaxID=126358 RepID=A0ABD1TL24_9LAMI